MEPNYVNDCLTPHWQLLKKLVVIGFRDSVSSGYDSLSKLIIAPESVRIALLNPILHSIPYHR